MLSKKLFGMFTGILFLVASFGAYAQNMTVRGTVSDNVGPIVGAVVLSGGANAVTDMNGAFTISVPSNAVLEVSCLGYVSQEVPVNGRTNINVVLVEDAEVLQEAVALGYGAQTKKKDLSASVGIVNNAEQLAARPVTSTTAMLQGQVAGVVVSSNGGSPTSGPSILIRGQGSKNGDSVLWVVDGVPGAPIVSMNDIESIVVLKDAASAAIYGASSGAGGVIIVTTKKANKGVHVEYDVVTGVRSLSNLPQSLDGEQMCQMRNLSLTNAGMSVSDGYNPTKNPWAATTRTDWFKELFRPAFYQRHDVALNYGTDAYKGRLTFSFQDNQGIVVGSYNKTLGIRYNGEFNLNKWIKVTEDVSFSHSGGRAPDTGSAYSGTILNAIYMPRSSEVRQSSGPLEGKWGGVFTEDPAYFAQYGNYGALFDGMNPVRLATDQDIWNGSTNFWSTTGLEVANVIKGLRFRTQFTYNLNQSMSKDFTHRVLEVGAASDANGLSWNTGRSDKWIEETTLTYDRTFGKHTVGVLGAMTFDHYNARGFSLSGSGFEDESDYLQYIRYASGVNGNDYYTGDDANIAFVGRLAYSYDDRYFVTASYRRDYAGRLPDAHNYGDFPAVTGAWKVSSEPFFPKNDVVNLLKIRASWGRIGNLGSIGMNYKSATMGYEGNANYRVEAATYGVENKTGWGILFRPGTTINNTLTWETSQQVDVGVDIDLFKERLSLSADYYNKLTYNLIQSQSTGWPQTIGWGAMLVNQGRIRNSGIELSATWRDRIGKDFSYFLTGNYAYNKNVVVSTGVMDDQGNAAPWSGGGDWRMVPWIYQTEAGQPLNSFFVIKSDGIFQSEEDIYEHNKDGKLIQGAAQPGDLRFVDLNDDGKIDNADRQYVGTSIPPHTFALTAGFDWKGFNFSMMWQGVAGNKIAYVAKSMILSDMEGNFNRSAEILNAWSPTNTHSSIPRLSKNDPNGNFTTASDWYIEDGSYLRLKNLTVGYDLTKLIHKLPHFAERNSSCSVYFSGENLLTFTRYSGMDPEVGSRDTMVYPVSRVLAFGVKINY